MPRTTNVPGQFFFLEKFYNTKTPKIPTKLHNQICSLETLRTKPKHK